MNEEELEKVKGIVKRLYAGTGVTVGDILDTAPWLDKLVNEVEKLQKRIKASQNFAKIVERDYIDKDEIKQLVGYEENEDVSKDEIILLLKTMWEEFNRLEDIEDKMFTKYISKDVIRKFIKEELPDDEIMESCEMFDMNGVYLREKLEELLGE